MRDRPHPAPPGGRRPGGPLLLAALLAALLAGAPRAAGAASPVAARFRIPLPPHAPAFSSRTLPEVRDVEFAGSKEARLRGALFRPHDPVATVIVLHGLGGQRVGYYPVALELAREGFAVLVYSMRAHGDSGGDYDLGAMVDDVSAAVGEAKRLAPGLPVFLLGGSTGGLVGFAAARHDERIERVALVAAPLSFNDVVAGDRFYRNLTHINRRRFPLPDWLTDLVVKIGVDSVALSEARLERTSDWDERKILVYRINRRGLFASDYADLRVPRGTLFVARSLEGPSMADGMPDCPVFAVVGSGDEVTRTGSAYGIARYHRALPGARLLVVPGDHRHRTYLTDMVRQRVRDFFLGM